MKMKRDIKSYSIRIAVISGLVYFASNCIAPDKDLNEAIKDTVDVWMTSGDKSLLLARTRSSVVFGPEVGNDPIIEVDSSQRFQEIDGFGFALTGGSAYLLNKKLNTPEREALLKELFLTNNNNIGISYLRISIGASDLDDRVFSYNDQPAGKRDVSLTDFNLAPDEVNLIPVLKQILALQREVKIMASPWTAPSWMKSNNSTKGGSLEPAYYDSYARYLVKYVRAMAKHDIPIDAITLQNEPENPNNNPSMLMTAEEQANFVKNNLGPAFKAAGLTTKIVVFDHNCDHPEYPISVLNDEDAKKYIDGSAFHLYLGEIDALSKVRNSHPDRNIYFTEQWTSAKGDFGDDLTWHVKNIIVGATRNWSRNVLEWNLAADPKFHPHTDGGCTECRGALTIGDSVVRNVSYYIVAQASKFVRPGSVRIASNIVDNLYNVAFEDIYGKKILIVLNDANETKNFGIKYNGEIAHASLPGRTVATFIW